MCMAPDVGAAVASNQTAAHQCSGPSVHMRPHEADQCSSRYLALAGKSVAL